MTDDDDPRITDLADQTATSDPEDVYGDLESLPSWWREAVCEFETYDLRPYRPSRFTDGEIVRETVDRLEDRYGVEIRIGAKNPSHDGQWTVYVDGDPITDVEHRRKPEGYTVYGVSSERFEQVVIDAARSGESADGPRDSE